MDNQERWTKIIGDIARERDRQDLQWGGAAHDDEHIPYDWQGFIEKQCRRLCSGAIPANDYREHLVKIAAIAVAAIESYDRKAGK